MASFTTSEKAVLEKLFQMGSGYVLNFSDKTFTAFFKSELNVDIDDAKYNLGPSASKANRLRSFWQVSTDAIAGKSILKLIEHVETHILIGRLQKSDFPDELLKRTRDIALRLSGTVDSTSGGDREEEFISRQFIAVSVDKIGLQPSITNILNQRLGEIKKCMNSKAALATIFLCGSTLEGILLGLASAKPKEFNQSNASPKDITGKVKPLADWTLNDFINVARSLNLIGEDVKKFSHALRDFRNYIHPYEQMASGFEPDEHTARICWQVLQAAITDLSR